MANRFRRGRVLLVWVACCIAAWSQSDRKLEPTGQFETGQIYVYANWEFPEHKWVDVACDDGIVAKIKAGRYFVLNLSPGRHAVSERDGIPAFVEVRSGEKAYLRLGREVDGQTVMPVLSRVNANDAAGEIVHLAYIDAAKVFSGSVLKDDRGLQQKPQLKSRDDRGK
ncbi:MAG TPA: hypothetical protein VKV39_19340 [Candidatus Sulfotelmatobacter sp.]|nr:hypothetical protein [Candidatus Sulfotelmatobacter sp.]